MNNKLEKKLGNLPQNPGVYFFKNEAGQIIYIGKASNLRNRVRSYFQKGRPKDTKTTLLVNSIADLEWQMVETEADALFLEAEMVRRYMPDYNILLRDDKSSQFVRIDYKSDHPTVTLVRRPLPDGAEYFGPFINGLALKKSLRYLRRAFPYSVSKSRSKRASLHFYLGLDPGLEEGKTSLADYRSNLRRLMRYLRGQKKTLINELTAKMKSYSKTGRFEEAAQVRDQLKMLDDLGRQTLLSSSELEESNRDHALAELSELLQLVNLPRRIEGFDISHIQGSDNSASMVVFTLGLPDKTEYRKFKLRLGGNDDFAHMNEALTRRLSPRNVNRWGLPKLILIDGGKGQLSAAIAARDQAGLSEIPTIGIAKREEKIVLHKSSSLPGRDINVSLQRARAKGAYVDDSSDFAMVLLPQDSYAIKLLQRIRDESHRFALSYHGSLRRQRSGSLLDSLPGVGVATRKALIRKFGSLSGARQATVLELQELLGEKRGAKIFTQLKKL